MSKPNTDDHGVASFPQRLGRYELLLPIGAGGMATVYLARTRVIDDLYREFAVKLMRPHVGQERDVCDALIEEAKIAARIRHPNVVSVIDVGEHPSGVFLVMDYICGDTLSGLLRAARAAKVSLPFPIAGRILIDMLSGLHAAHELRDSEGKLLGLVHRDVSPQNVLVGVDGISRLTDFGIAKSAARTSVTVSGVTKGKLAYMAPEQAMAKRVDRRTDVWAAGVVAWEVLAGRRLRRTSDDPVAAILSIASTPPVSLRSVRPTIPEEVAAAVASALELDREKRCPDAATLRDRLARAWNAVDSIADHTEVAEFVQRIVGPKLAERRVQAAAALELRTETEPMITAAPASNVSDEPTALPVGRKSVALGVAVVLAGVVVLAVLAVRSSRAGVSEVPPLMVTVGTSVFAKPRIEAKVVVEPPRQQVGVSVSSAVPPSKAQRRAPRASATTRNEQPGIVRLPYD